MTEQNYIEERKFVSRLIFMTLAETLHVRDAILKFPKDSNDSSIRAAYHALVHFEADEDLRRRDLDYKDEQDDYLELLAQILQEGKELPKNIIKGYDKYYKGIQTPYSDSVKGFIKRLCKFLNV